MTFAKKHLFIKPSDQKLNGKQKVPVTYLFDKFNTLRKK